MAQRAEIVLDDEEREVLERWARRPTSSQALAFRCRIVLAAAEGATSVEIAAHLGCNPRRSAGGGAASPERGIDGLHDEPRPGKPRSIGDDDVERVIVKTLEEQPARRHALVDALDGGGDGHEPDGDQPDLAGVRAQAAPDRGVQALARPAVHRQGPRHRRPLPQPARGGGRAVRRREVADPGARPHGAGAAAAARGARAAHPRLRAQRHDQPLRRARRRLRAGDRGDDASPPRRGVPPLPERDRRVRAGAPRRARRARQLLDPQDAGDQALARQRHPASRSTSPRPTPPGSTSSSAGSPS